MRKCEGEMEKTNTRCYFARSCRKHAERTGLSLLHMSPDHEDDGSIFCSSVALSTPGQTDAIMVVEGGLLWSPAVAAPTPASAPYCLSDQSYVSLRCRVFISQTLSDPFSHPHDRNLSDIQNPSPCLCLGHHLRPIENFLEKNLHFLTEVNSPALALCPCARQ